MTRMRISEIGNRFDSSVRRIDLEGNRRRPGGYRRDHWAPFVPGSQLLRCATLVVMLLFERASAYRSAAVPFTRMANSKLRAGSRGQKRGALSSNHHKRPWC